MRKWVILAVCLASSGIAYAGPFEDGVAAWKRQDYATALRLFRPLADQGDVYAQASLAYMYANGEGVPENDVQAYKWWNLAAAQGHADAKANKAIVEKKMTREQIAEAQKLSAEWKPE